MKYLKIFAAIAFFALFACSKGEKEIPKAGENAKHAEENFEQQVEKRLENIDSLPKKKEIDKKKAKEDLDKMFKIRP
jgi:hypothetical protein